MVVHAPAASVRLDELFPRLDALVEAVPQHTTCGRLVASLVDRLKRDVATACERAVS